MKARHLEAITLLMELGVEEPYAPYMVEAVLSALTKLPALKTLTLNMIRYRVRCVVLE